MIPKIVAIVQARMGSHRLPGKTLVDIAGQPFLSHVLDRVRASRTVQEIVVATTTAVEDLAIVELAERKGAATYRGSAEDVLDRFHQAATRARAGIIVRITADDPFKDPDVIDLIAGRLLTDAQPDYVSNTLAPTFPEGLDVEAFTFAALERAWKEGRLPSEREHVTPYIWKNPGRFRLENVLHSEDLSRLRWTLDYEEDLRFTREVYSRLYRGQVFKMDEILALLKREPHLAAINHGLQRNAGYTLSLQQDQNNRPPSS